MAKRRQARNIGFLLGAVGLILLVATGSVVGFSTTQPHDVQNEQDFSTWIQEEEDEPTDQDVEEEVAFELSITDLPDSVTAGDSVTVEVEVTNTGERRESQTVVLTAGGEEVDSKEVDLNASSSEILILTWETSEDQQGHHTIAVHDAEDNNFDSVQVDEPSSLLETALPLLFIVIGGGLGITAGIAAAPRLRPHLPLVETDNSGPSDDGTIQRIYSNLYRHGNETQATHQQRDQGQETHHNQSETTPEEYRQRILEDSQANKFVYIDKNAKKLEESAENIIETRGEKVPDDYLQKISLALEIATENDDTESTLIRELESLQTNGKPTERPQEFTNLIDTLIDYEKGEAKANEVAAVIEEIVSDSNTSKSYGLVTKLDTIKATNNQRIDSIDETGEKLIETVRAYEEGETGAESLVQTIENTIVELASRGQVQDSKLVTELDSFTAGSLNHTIRDLAVTIKKYERREVDEKQVRQRIEDANEYMAKIINQKRTYKKRLENIDDQLNREWIQSHYNTEIGDEPGRLAQQSIGSDVVGERVVSVAAQDVQQAADNNNTGFNPGSRPYKFIKQLASARPTKRDYDAVKTSLGEQGRRLSEYEEFENFDLKSLADVEQKYDNVSGKTSRLSDSTSEVISDIAQEEYAKAKMLQDGALVEPSLIYERLVMLELVLEQLDDEGRQAGIDTREIEDRRDDVEEAIEKIDNIKSGHRIARWYLNAADELEKKASEASESGDDAAAQAYLDAAYHLVDQIYKMYTNDTLVDILAWADE